MPSVFVYISFIINFSTFKLDNPVGDWFARC